ncbi:MAG: fibronectin type III domain-containing protein [Candidatus Sericytochromatia bacterium]
MLKHRSNARVFALFCALSLSACGPAPSTQTGPSASPNALPSAGPTVTPSTRPDTSTQELTVSVKADASLAGFATNQQSAFTLCLGQIASASTRLTLPSGLSEAALNALRSGGATIETDNGQTTATVRQNLTLRDLLSSIEFKLRGVPGGSVEGRTTFMNAAGAELGFVSWRADVSATGKEVSVQLSAGSGTQAGENCPSIQATVSGATFLGAGGQVSSTQPLPNPQSSPSSEPSPSPVPAQGNPPGAPLNAKVVEQTSSSLTLQWEFPADARSFKLYLDGTLVTSDYVTPNYYRFEGLSPSTSYRLGVQSVNPAGQSEISTVTSAPISNGHTGSGNFSGGGGSRPRPSASTGSSFEPIPEFRVNTETIANQGNPAIAMDADADFVVTWESRNQDGSSYGIFAQRYDATGTAQGSEFQVNTYTTSTQINPAIAMDADGDFVVTWQSFYQDGYLYYGIFAQRYNAAGTAQGTEFQVNTYTRNQTNPAIAMDADGDFVITWQSRNQDGGNNDGIFAQRYNTAGRAQGSEFQVNTYTTNNQRNPAIAMDADGDFVVTWQSFYQDGYFDGIYSAGFTATD